MASVLVFGDICPDNNYRRLFDKNVPFSDAVVSDIQKTSLVIANLECPATMNNVPIVKTGPNLRAEPCDLKLLSDIGFDLLSLANNHILDYGILAVQETIERAGECGIKTVGAGRNINDSRRPVIMNVESKKVGIISFAEAEFNLATEFAPGANHFDPYTSFDDVRKLKKNSDYVIVLYHGGIEHYKYPSPLLQKKCRKFVMSGADLVLCQHSHCIGTMERITDGTIVYGQGNSVFGYREGNASWNEGWAVEIELETGKLLFRLLKATPDGVVYASEKEEEERLRQMLEESCCLDDQEQIESLWSSFCQTQAAMDLPMLFGRGRVFNKLNRLIGNRLIKALYSRRKQRITMNLIRCESHHEVLQTILENAILK